MRGLTLDQLHRLLERRIAWCAGCRAPAVWETLSAGQQVLVERAEASCTWYARIVRREHTRQRLGLRGTWGG